MKILFCTDGSRQSENAVRFGARIAAACRAESSVLGIVEKNGREDALHQALLRAQAILKEHRLDVELIAGSGTPAPEIIKYTEENRYDMVVIGAPCRSPFWNLLAPRWIAPMNAYTVIECAEPPVMVVFCDHPRLRRILLCTNGRDYGDKAIEFAGKIARSIGAVVNLFYVMPEPPAMYADIIRLEQDSHRLIESNSKPGRVLRRQKDLLEDMGVFGEIRLRHGYMTPQLQKELRQTRYDLVISGSRQTGDKTRKYVVGEVTREMINRAEIPILIIRSGHGPARLFKTAMDVLLKPFRKAPDHRQPMQKNRAIQPVLHSSQGIGQPLVREQDIGHRSMNH
jgi:nucleotide-binding universal stress UspA family protein